MKPLKLPCKYQLGAVVYHRMDTDSGAGIVTEVRFCADGGILFEVKFGPNKNAICYEIELSTAKTWTAPETGDGGSATDNE